MKQYLTLTFVVTSTVCAPVASWAETQPARTQIAQSSPSTSQGRRREDTAFAAREIAWQEKQAQASDEAQAFVATLHEAAKNDTLMHHIAPKAKVNFIEKYQPVASMPLQQAVSQYGFDAVFTPAIQHMLKSPALLKQPPFHNSQGSMVGSGAVWFTPEGITFVNAPAPAQLIAALKAEAELKAQASFAANKK